LKEEPKSTKHEHKIYLVTHRELSPGYQTAQTAHAIAELLINKPDVAAEWYTQSNSLIVLTVANEEALHELLQEAKKAEVHAEPFREPDLLDELTAIAFTPSPTTRKLLANLPLLKHQPEHVTAGALERENRYRTLANQMMACPQTANQNVLQHGRSVREHYFALLDHLEGRTDLSVCSNWVIPEWLDTHRELLLSKQPSRYIMDRYLTLHDCGKPAVRVVDEEGKQHFPGHAEKSAETYRECFQETANPTVEWLIAHDMDVHLLTADDVPSFATQEHALGLLLAGFAELTSNAAMFGGVSSVGFKMKYKKLNQRAKAVLKLVAGNVRGS